MENRRFLAALSLATLPAGASVLALADCSSSSPGVANQCNGPATMTISNAAALSGGNTLGDATIPPGVVVTGTVSGAPCGVSGVSLMAAVPAASSLPNFATWSATVPLAQFEGAGTCDAGVNVFAQASIVGMPGVPNAVIDAGQCVSVLQPNPPSVCDAPAACFSPVDSNGPAGVQCQLPITSGAPLAPAMLGFFAESVGTGRQVTWRSAMGLSAISPTSPTVRTATSSETTTCERNKCPSTACATDAFGYAIGSPTASPGVDFITASMDGYVNPVLTVEVAVQGPAKLTPTAATLSNGASVLVVVQNPMAFVQTCQVSLPVGTSVSALAVPLSGDAGADGISLDAGAFLGVQSCDVPSDDSGGVSVAPCIAQYTSTATGRVLVLSFASGITPAEAQANGLGTAHALTITCQDQFAQTATLSIPASWGSSGADAGSGGSPGGADAAPADAGGG